MNNLLTSLFIMLSLSAFGQNIETKPILFDGLYETKCEFEEDDDEGSQSYLRFYPDGKVISVGTDCEGTADELKDWFHINAEQAGVGNYDITGRKLRFSTTSKTGTVSYKGRIINNNIIRLKWKSQTNGERGHEEYTFVKVIGLR